MNAPVDADLLIHDGIDRWEEELYLSCKRRARMAYLVAGVAGVISVLSVSAVMLLTPLKTVEPIVITVDKNTGLANVSSTLGELSLSDDEAVTQSLLFRYTRDRETYAAYDHKGRLEAVFEMSRGSAASDLKGLYKQENPNNPMNIYGSSGIVSVEIQSVVLTETDRATIRMKKTARKQPGAPENSRNYVATVTFAFDRTGAMSLKERWNNPTGFFVTNYRIDEEAN